MLFSNYKKSNLQYKKQVILLIFKYEQLVWTYSWDKYKFYMKAEIKKIRDKKSDTNIWLFKKFIVLSNIRKSL